MEYILKSVSGQSGNTRIIWAHSTIILENKKNYWKQNVRRDPIYEKKLWPMQPYIRVIKGKPKTTFYNFPEQDHWNSSVPLWNLWVHINK